MKKFFILILFSMLSTSVFAAPCNNKIESNIKDSVGKKFNIPVSELDVASCTRTLTTVEAEVMYSLDTTTHCTQVVKYFWIKNGKTLLIEKSETICPEVCFHN